jgi:hypothetical protein
MEIEYSLGYTAWMAPGARALLGHRPRLLPMKARASTPVRSRPEIYAESEFTEARVRTDRAHS